MPVVGSVEVSVVPSAEGFNDKLRDELEPQADELGISLGEKLRAGIDTGLHDIKFEVNANTGRAEAEIEALRAQVDDLKHDRANIEVNVDNANGVRSWMTSLIAGAVAIAPAFIVAAGGIAAFAGLAVPEIKKVIDAQKALAQGGTAAKDAWSGLSNSERDLEAGISTLRTEFDDLSASIKPEVIADFDKALAVALPLLSELEPVAEAGGRAVGTLIDDLGKALTGSDAQKFFDFMAQNMEKDVQEIGQTLESLITLIFSLTEALQPVSFGLLAIINTGAKFLSWLANTAPALTDIIVLAIALAKPLRVIQGLDLANSFAWVGKAATGLEEFTATATVAAAQEKVLALAADEASAGWLMEIGTAEALNVVIDEMTVSETALAVASAALDAVNPFVWVAAGIGAIAALGALLVNTAPSIDGVTDALKKQDDAVGFNVAGYQKLADQTSNVVVGQGQVGKAVQNTVGGFQVAKEGAQAYEGALGQVNQVHNSAVASADNLRSHLGTLEQMYGLTQKQAEQLAKSAGVSASALAKGGQAGQQAMNQIENYASANERAAQSTSAWAAQMSIATGAAGTLDQRVTALTTAMHDLFDPTTNLISAQITFKDDQVSLASALKATSGAIGTQTAASRTASQATVTAVNDAIQLSGAIQKQTGSASAAVGPLEALKSQLEQAGLKGQGAAQLIQELNAQIAALKSKTVDIDVVVHQAGSLGAVNVSTGTGLKAAAGGAVIPGYSPGVDSRTIAVSPGEAVLVPELTRAIGPANIMALNKEYSGRPPGSASAGMAGGGVAGTVMGQDTFNVILNMIGSGGSSSVSGTDSAEKLAAEFASGTLKTVSEIKAAGVKAVDDLKDYYTGPHSKELQAALNKQVTSLEQLVTASNKISTEMASMKQIAAQETSSLASFSDLSNIQGQTDASGNQLPVTSSDVSSGLAQDLATLKQFLQVIKQLQAMKVSKVLINQVIALGPKDGVTYGEAIIAGGASLVKELNADETAISKVDVSIGQADADVQFGQPIGKAFLSGLKSQQAAINKQMGVFGNQISVEMLKALDGKKIKISSSGAISAGATSTATSVGGTTQVVQGGGMSQAQVNSINSHIQDGTNVLKTLVTKAQMTQLINAVKALPAQEAAKVGPAVAAALNASAKTAATAARTAT